MTNSFSGNVGKAAFYGSALYGLYLLVLLTLPYLSFDLNTDFLKTKRSVIHLSYFRIAFYAHIFSSPILILTGLAQFLPSLLRDKPAVHRLLGKIYLITLLAVAAPGGMVLAVYANGYLLTKLSFVVLTSLWIVSAFLAYTTARKRNFSKHGNWMVRNFALTLSAITLRFYAYLLGYLDIHLPPKDAYTLISLLSWIPNLLAAEVLIKTGYVKRFLLASNQS